VNLAQLDQLQEETFAKASPATRDSYPPERRMVGEELRSYLDRRVFAVVSSTRRSGRPHAALSSYVRRNTTFWLPTVAGSIRERNLQSQPWLVLVVAEGDRGDHVAVIVEGPGAVMTPADVPADVVATAPDAWVSLWLRLDAQRLLSYAAEGATGRA
jgi:hypothetical protein